MSYQREKDQFIARMAQEGLPLQVSQTLLRCATTIQRLAELACSSEAADRDRIPCPASTQFVRQYGSARNRPMQTRTVSRKADGPCLCDRPNDGHETIPRIALQDHRAEQRATKAVPDGWRVLTQGDPRGYTLKVIPPSYAERNASKDRHNLDSIGVPVRDSRLRF